MTNTKALNMTSKFLFSIAICFFASSSLIAQNVETAGSILSGAYDKASKQNKNVIVIFHASWCGWCKKLDASMNDATTKKYFEDNFVTVHLTVQETNENKRLENAGAAEYLATLKGEKAGLPFFAILNNKGDVIDDSFSNGENIGCPATDDEVAAFITKLKKTSKINEDGLKIIAARFKQNSVQE